MTTRNLKIAGNLQTRAAFDAATFDEKSNTVEVVFTTGARGKRYSWSEGPYFEELEVSEGAVDLSRLNNGAPVLNAHDAYSLGSVIGVIVRAWLVGKEGRAQVRFSDREDVKPIVADVRGGILRHVSVGYSIQKLEKIEEVDGVPVYRATKWTPGEISFVPMGFDDRATVRGKAEAEFYEVEITNQERKMLLTEEEKAKIAAEEATRAADAAAKAASESATRAAADNAVKAERERCAVINSLVSKHKLGDAMANDLIGRGVSVDAARSAVLDKLAEASDAIKTEQHTRFEAGESEREKFIRGASAWMVEKAAVANLIRSAQKTTFGANALAGFEFDGGEFRGMSMVDLARHCLERSGVKTRGVDKMKLMGDALTRDAGMNSSSDFSVLLETIVNKTLLAAYATTPDCWREFCAVRSVSDFRAQNFYRNGSFGTLDSLNEHGEFARKSIPDGEKSSISVGTKGNIIGITRKALVNDDMGAFNDLATRWGRAAALSIESDVFATILLNAGLGPTMGDGVALFHANHKNIGTSAALSVSSLDADAALMAGQKDPSGNEILDLQPSILIVPRGLKGEAIVMNDAQFEPADNKFQKPNRVRGLFSKIVATPRLTGTRRYTLADPSIAPVFAVAFLEGQQAPVLESMHGWNVDGTEWKVRIDYGVGAIDYRGAVTNAGT